MKRSLQCKVGDEICSFISNANELRFVFFINLMLGDEEGSCKFCGKTFPTIRGLTVHLSKHFADKKFQCDLCSNKYTTEGNLKKHISNAHSGNLIDCEICRKKSFTSRKKLEEHQAKHFAQDVHVTEHCKPTDARPMPQLIPMPVKESSNEISLFSLHNWMKRE